jgi:hypothetical protein
LRSLAQIPDNLLSNPETRDRVSQRAITEI